MCNDGAGELDRSLQQLWGDFWSGQIPWGHLEFNLTNDSWGPTGFLNRDITRPYAKMINSIFLIARGLIDYGGGCRQWHATSDYVDSCRGNDNRFHGEYYYQFTQDFKGRPAHAETGRLLATDRTVCHCPLFNIGATYDSPSLRASALVHESWHHWQYEHDFDGAHPLRPGNKEGDHYYRHTAEAFPFGQMHTYDLNPAHFRFLSPYQVQAEFLDDLHVFCRRDAPIALFMAARREGNAVLEQKFVNPPRYRLGEPKPF